MRRGKGLESKGRGVEEWLGKENEEHSKLTQLPTKIIATLSSTVLIPPPSDVILILNSSYSIYLWHSPSEFIYTLHFLEKQILKQPIEDNYTPRLYP